MNIDKRYHYEGSERKGDKIFSSSFSRIEYGFVLNTIIWIARPPVLYRESQRRARWWFGVQYDNQISTSAVRIRNGFSPSTRLQVESLGKMNCDRRLRENPALIDKMKIGRLYSFI
jgi:hypothetical protein